MNQKKSKYFFEIFFLLCFGVKNNLDFIDLTIMKSAARVRPGIDQGRCEA